MNRISLISAAAIAFVAGACAPAAPPAAEAQAPIQLFAMNCGQISISDADMFADNDALKGQARDLIDPCYLIRHPSGDLIWDAGLPEALAATPEGAQSGPFHLTVPARLTDQLAQLDLTPADIEFLSVSHSHFDHVGNAALFTAATWIVDADERAYMFRDEARADENFALVAPLEAMTTQLIEGDSVRDVFGDGRVTIHQTPGHTPGHTVLLVKLANAGPVLLTGDMWHMAESHQQRLVPRFNVDHAQSLASMDVIEGLATAENARIIRQHVPEDFAALPAFPAALD